MATPDLGVLINYPYEGTWDIFRTFEAQQSGAINCLDVILEQPKGFPKVDKRLYREDPDSLLAYPKPSLGTMNGQRIWLYDLPPGEHRTKPEARAAWINDPQVRSELLYGEPDEDIPYGTLGMPATHTSAMRAFDAGCRRFDINGHPGNRLPLIPGFPELVKLARYTEDKGMEPVGLPTGLGGFGHYGLAPMADGTTLRLHRDRLEALLYRRPGSAQSDSVMATSGGFVIKSDCINGAANMLHVASARRTKDRTGLDVSTVPSVEAQAKLPFSSPTTAHCALKSHVLVRVLPDDFPVPRRLQGSNGEEAGWYALEDICRDNAQGGYSGTVPKRQGLWMWTTHVELLSHAVRAVLNPYNKDRLGLSWEKFGKIAYALGVSASQY